jgi:zinc transport system substrate-binding protein
MIPMSVPVGRRSAVAAVVTALVTALVTAPVAGLLGGCAALSVTRPARPLVVTAFYPLQFVAEQVAGPHAVVVNLTHPGQEPHDIELTVRQTAAVSDADVVLYERGFQAAVDQAVANDGPARDRVVDTAVAGGVHGNDPHFWLDPTRLGRVAAAFEKTMAAADPVHRAAYARNLARLRTQLDRLDAAFRHGLAHCRITTIVVSHQAFGYLGRRYGLRVVGINGLSPDAEPSPAHVRALHDLIRSDGIRAVFSERLASRAMARSLAHDLGIRAEVLDPIEGLGPATADQTYLSLMRRNLRTLRKANEC